MRFLRSIACGSRRRGPPGQPPASALAGRRSSGGETTPRRCDRVSPTVVLRRRGSHGPRTIDRRPLAGKALSPRRRRSALACDRSDAMMGATTQAQERAAAPSATGASACGSEVFDMRARLGKPTVAHGGVVWIVGRPPYARRSMTVPRVGSAEMGWATWSWNSAAAASMSTIAAP